MTVMTQAATKATHPRGRAFTYADLETMPDDGHRYEIIDGVLIVTPSPRHVHQRGVGNLYLVFRAACPDHLEVLLAPFDVKLAEDTVMIPDLLVARRDDITERNLPVAPVLALEVLSPSTRSFDLHTKKDRFRRAGCAHYWVIDPLVPSVTAWSLNASGETATYELVGEATGEDTLQVAEPFAMRVTPQDLIER